MFWLLNLKILNKFYFRILFFLLVFIMAFFVHWIFILTAVIFLIILFSEFYEAVFLGFILDVLSGAPFCVFILIFLTAVFSLKEVKKFVYAG